MGNYGELPGVMEEFCLAWFELRNFERTIQYISEDILFTGTGEGENVQGLTAFKEYVRQDIRQLRDPFEVEVTGFRESRGSGNMGFVSLEFNLKNSDYSWHLHGTAALALAEGGWKIRQLHFSVPTTQQEVGEHYPLALVRKQIDKARNELLSASVAGGLMGGYLEDKFPFYYVNGRMLAYLGYDSEADFVEDIGGYIINCIHPDDRAETDRSVAEQLEYKDHYEVEFRMRKKNGAYIHVNDVGRVITAEDGRQAIISVCRDISIQRFERQQNEVLISALNGGTTISKLVEGRYVPLYMSSGVGSISGYTQKELMDLMTVNPELLIYSQDREKMFSAIERVMGTGDTVEETFRLRQKNGGFVWASSILQKMEDDNGAPLLHCIFSSLSKQFELQSDILDGTETGIYVIDPENYELCLANKAAFQIIGAPVGNYRGRKCYEMLAEKSVPCADCMLHSGCGDTREIYMPGLDKTVVMTARQSQWMGRNVIIGYLSDISGQKKDEQELKLGEERLTAALQHASVQFWDYDIQRNRAYNSEFSQKSYKLPAVMDNFPQEFLNMGYVHPDDQEAYLALHERLKNGAKSAMLEYRVYKPGVGYSWLLCHYTTSFDREGRPVRAFATGENIDRYKEMEEQFTVASGLIGMRVWTVDLQNQSLLLSESDALEKGVDRVLPCRTKEELMSSGMIHPDDLEVCWKRYQELFKGVGTTSFNVRLKNNGEYRWNRVSYTVMRSKGGLPVKSVGTSIDIHEHVLLEQRFEQELKYSAGLQAPNLIAKVQSNITKDTVDLYVSDKNAAISFSGADYKDGAESLAMAAVEQEKQEQIRYLLNRERILNAFARGEIDYSIEYLRRGNDGTVFWVSTIARTYQNPATGDIMSFMYTYNIDEQKAVEAIIDRVVDTNFEYLTLFSTVTGLVEKTIDKAGVELKPEQGHMYGETVEVLGRILAPGEREECLLQFTVENIVDRLSKNGTYSISIDIMDSGQPRHKLWGYNWFDKTHTKILCTRSDITEVYSQEQQQKEALSSALAAARQANAAKSDFLSRMSHEIRTPMNAIIGMTAIAARSLGNEERVSDCISKIGISSRFLLSLINDILDMSRIESGKMLLKREQIPFKEFVTGVNTICHAQAAAKDVEYECIIDPLTDECYIGDAMKLQQVLVNIIGNAVKFTGSGGKVTFSINQSKRTNHNAELRFVINDTGIGMSEEFLSRLYEPFEQEDPGISAGYGGTGLGLAISKNIVDMMDGKIQVRSVKGAGTEFTIDVKLGITEEEKRYLKKQHSYHFTNLKTLVVDNDSMVCESAVLALKEIGVTAEWVDSGRQAVVRVQEKRDRKQYYDIILVDWKMPEMDGIETSRRLRKIVGPDVTIIIMTAYDWYSIEQEAKAAGVNLLMSKPMFKSSLVSAFSKALGQKEEKEAEAPAEEYNFSGRRLLLVEDQPINAQIARMLLEDVGFDVESAENGLRAIELFSKNGAGYYDAILMDIRMPIMDGLQAASNIRHLSNADARTIPIIAMTADAFDEDADKSKAAGMNLHLSKPIDPPKLYRTLYDFICGNH